MPIMTNIEIIDSPTINRTVMFIAIPVPNWSTQQSFSSSVGARMGIIFAYPSSHTKLQNWYRVTQSHLNKHILPTKYIFRLRKSHLPMITNLYNLFQQHLNNDPTDNFAPIPTYPVWFDLMLTFTQLTTRNSGMAQLSPSLLQFVFVICCFSFFIWYLLFIAKLSPSFSLSWIQMVINVDFTPPPTGKVRI